MPLLDSRDCDRLYHVGTDVPQAEHIVQPGNLCAGYLEGHKDACQVCLLSPATAVLWNSHLEFLTSLEPRTQRIKPPGCGPSPPPSGTTPGNRT